ncbi:MAG: DUF1573 domain-containing protein [Microscillaceae bacterium]|nr:DUF1573 domain-containing protein [Microscillaceae bacterium]
MMKYTILGNHRESLSQALFVGLFFGLMGLYSCAENKKAETASSAPQNPQNTVSAPTSNETGQKEPAQEPARQISKETGEKAMMAFPELEYNFGQVEEGAIVKHSFKFKNTGKVPLLISDASASCGCTASDWPKEPVLPGKESEIKVEFNTQGKPGQQVKTITLTANTEPTTTILRLSGMVKGTSKMMGPLANP